jgi:replicative DNA helicase
MSLNEEGRVRPNSVELEKAVLGVALLEKDGCDIVIDLLSQEVFYDERNGIIFRAIKEIHSRKEPVDILTATQELKKLKLLDSVGGAYEITSLTSRVSSSANTEHHCRILLQLFFKRSLIDIGKLTIDQGYDEFYDAFDSIDNVRKMLKHIESFLRSNAILNINDDIEAVIQKSEHAAIHKGIMGLASGIVSLDNAVGGFEYGLKYEIIADSSIGKSTLAKCICLNFAHKLDIPGVYFSYEVPRVQVVRNCISDILDISTEDIKKGKLSEADKIKMRSLKDTLFTKNFIIYDDPTLDTNDIRSILRKLKETHGARWFVIDYLGLMKLKGKEWKGKTDEAIIAEITAETKRIAKELDMICIELCQVTKETGKRTNFRPHIGDAKGSQAIAANADTVILIYRPEHYGIKTYWGISTSGKAELIIAKQRDGRLSNPLVDFIGEYNRFSDSKGLELEPEDGDNEPSGPQF